MNRAFAIAVVLVAACGSSGSSGDMCCSNPDLAQAAPPVDLKMSAAFPLTDAGCVTGEAVSSICGTHSNDRICKLAIMCGVDDNDGQCKINCEQGTSINCYSEASAECLVNAMDCASLKACNWIL